MNVSMVIPLQKPIVTGENQELTASSSFVYFPDSIVLFLAFRCACGGKKLLSLSDMQGIYAGCVCKPLQNNKETTTQTFHRDEGQGKTGTGQSIKQHTGEYTNRKAGLRKETRTPNKVHRKQGEMHNGLS